VRGKILRGKSRPIRRGPILGRREGGVLPRNEVPANRESRDETKKPGEKIKKKGK